MPIPQKNLSELIQIWQKNTSQALSLLNQSLPLLIEIKNRTTEFEADGFVFPEHIST